MLLTLVLTVAVTSALRSMWSPCGLSMLSTLTPLSERSRGHRYPLTATWFVLGATLGGAALAVPVSVGAYLLSRLEVPAVVTVLLFAVAALVAVAADLHLFGLWLPNHPRQVDETWLGRYRRWIYAAGFGVQIGAGLATYVMTAGVYLLIVGAVLLASWPAAAACCVVFGLTRGLLVLVAAPCNTPERLRAVHRFLDRRAEDSVTLMAVVLVIAAGGAGATLAPGWGAATAVVGAGFLGLHWWTSRPVGPRRPSGTRPAVPATPDDVTVA